MSTYTGLVTRARVMTNKLQAVAEFSKEYIPQEGACMNASEH
jgi:hypothetical protein